MKSPLAPLTTISTALGLLFTASAAYASPRATETTIQFASRGTTAKAVVVYRGGQVTQMAASGATVGLGAAVAVATRLGQVTSTIRTPARNRFVGGARNSHHLHGRALDVVRRAGVRHSDIEAALRSEGFDIVESLDEGDHSHFAFRSAGARANPVGAAIQRRTSKPRVMTIVK